MQGLSHDEIIEKHPRHHAAWKNREIDFVPESGESLQQFYDRVLKSTISWAERYRNQTIAIVAHGGVLDCLNRAATKRSLDAVRDFEILNASLNTLSYKEGELELIEWGNVAHLQITDEGNDYSLDEVDGSPKWV
jgi:probable phosphoglycerate mutase